MLFDKNGTILATDAEDRILDMPEKKIQVYYRGFVWVKGKKAGEDSVRYIANRFAETDAVPFEEIRGAFSAFIRKGDMIVAFSDNSNMHCLYLGDQQYISTSCLQLAEEMKKLGKLDFNENAFFQQYLFDKLIANETYVKQITAISWDQYLVIRDQRISVIPKGIEDISGKSRETSLYDFLNDFAESITEEKVLCSLTGGYDSRTIFSVINNTLDVDTAISGDNLKEKDVIIGRKVAKAAGKEMELVVTEKPDMSDQYLQDLFRRSDGMEMYIRNERIRWSQYVDYMIRHRYSLCISGDGGVLHKDWCWIQDFPFYRRKRTDTERFYRQRMLNVRSYKHAGSKLMDSYDRIYKETVGRLERFKGSLNTESYDMYYNYITAGNRIFQYNLSNGESLYYAPLQEREIVQFSYHLPRFARFFYNQNRQTITRANAKLAAIPTNYGMTASSSPICIVRDVFSYIAYFIGRVLRFLYRKVTGENLGGQKALTWSCLHDLRQNDLALKAIESGKKAGYLKETSQITDLGENQIGALIYAYLWKQVIE